MANRTSPIREARFVATSILRDLGRELRLARILAGATQSQVGRHIGRSASYVSRVERGRIVGAKLPMLVAHAAAVGLKPWVRLFPARTRPMDAPQLDVFARLRARISPAWRVELEVPVAIPGDLRAADVILSAPGCRILVEIITRLADFQAQVRAARLKHRDLRTDRLIVVVAATTTNRRVLREIGPAANEAFPLATRPALEALAAGRDPGADAIVLL